MCVKLAKHTQFRECDGSAYTNLRVMIMYIVVTEPELSPCTTDMTWSTNNRTQTQTCMSNLDVGVTISSGNSDKREGEESAEEKLQVHHELDHLSPLAVDSKSRSSPREKYLPPDTVTRHFVSS